LHVLINWNLKPVRKVSTCTVSAESAYFYSPEQRFWSGRIARLALKGRTISDFSIFCIIVRPFRAITAHIISQSDALGYKNAPFQGFLPISKFQPHRLKSFKSAEKA